MDRTGVYHRHQPNSHQPCLLQKEMRKTIWTNQSMSSSTSQHAHAFFLARRMSQDLVLWQGPRDENQRWHVNRMIFSGFLAETNQMKMTWLTFWPHHQTINALYPPVALEVVCTPLMVAGSAEITTWPRVVVRVGVGMVWIETTESSEFVLMRVESAALPCSPDKRDIVQGSAPTSLAAKLAATCLLWQR